MDKYQFKLTLLEAS